MNFEKTSVVESSAQALFQWHARSGAFQRLSPPWAGIEVEREDAGLDVGKRVEMTISTPLGRRRWSGEHLACRDGKEFVDTQVKGPFASWTHTHRFVHLSDIRSRMEDSIEYELPGGRLGRRFGANYVARQLERTFAYRHAIVAGDARFWNLLGNPEKHRVLIVGGSGFLGTHLGALLSTQGHEIAVLTRAKRRRSDIRWDPAKGEVEAKRLEGFDAVVNLAGENLTSGRWTVDRKRRLWASRVDATRFLVDAMLRLERPPRVFLSGSGINIYGSDPEAVFQEDSRSGAGFLPDLCEAWEAAAERAASFADRVVLLRSGVVLDPRGGALQRMLPPFLFGAGGPIGSGEQWFPWIALEDWIKATSWCLFEGRARGPVNMVAPGVLRQREFAAALGRVLHRPARLPVPKTFLRAAFGEMADAALLSSVRARPAALESFGYPFGYPDLEAALRMTLGRMAEA